LTTYGRYVILSPVEGTIISYFGVAIIGNISIFLHI
jgi:hypothetical protein